MTAQAQETATATPRGTTETRIVRLSELVIPEYQRKYDERRAAIIAKEWTEELFVTPRVRPRSDGKYDVLDGQHTVGALRLLGEQEVEVALARVSDEEAAGLFADLNSKRKRLTPYETFVAERHAGRPLAVELDRLVARYGCVISESPGPINLRCVAAAMRILKYHKNRPVKGPVLMDRTLRALTSSFHPSENRLSQLWVLGVSSLIEALSAAKSFDDNDLVQRLRKAHFSVEGTRVLLTADNLETACEAQLRAGRIRLSSSRSADSTAVLYGVTLAFVLYGSKRARELYPEEAR